MKNSQIYYFIIIALALVMMQCSSKREEFTKAYIPVETAQVQYDEIQQVVHTSGVLQSGQTTKLSFKIGGIIQEIVVKDGQSVKKGQYLAGLVQDEIQAQLSNAKTQYDKAARDYERANNLYQDNAISLQQKQDAQSGLDHAKATLQIAEFNASRTRITAPENGKILTVVGQENEMIDAGHPVLVFASTDRQWVVKAFISDKDVVKLSVGDSASVTLDAFPGSVYPAIVQEITETANQSTGLFAVEMVLLQKPARLISGLVAGVNIHPAKKNFGFLIPAGALYKARGKEGAVMVVDNDRVVHAIPVQIIGLYQDMLVVTGELSANDRIVTTGVSYIQPGDTVNVVAREVR